ncbi:MAG: hypothetical protein HGA86_04915, partial [Anaerolineaceae bacterium]|nr:hypothetical protein [Anaerolineaceae bacterium]
AGLLPRKLIPVSAELTGISVERPCHQVTVAERRTWQDQNNQERESDRERLGKSHQ